MANLILASKREVKSGAQMWHVYQHENGAKVADSEFYFALPYKALRDAWRWFPERSHKPQTWVRVPLPQPNTLVAQ